MNKNLPILIICITLAILAAIGVFIALWALRNKTQVASSRPHNRKNTRTATTTKDNEQDTTATTYLMPPTNYDSTADNKKETALGEQSYERTSYSGDAHDNALLLSNAVSNSEGDDSSLSQVHVADVCTTGFNLVAEPWDDETDVVFENNSTEHKQAIKVTTKATYERPAVKIGTNEFYTKLFVDAANDKQRQQNIQAWRT